MGKDGQIVPAMDDVWVQTISERYIELYEKVTGEKFVPQQWDDEQTNLAVEKELEKISS
jgi:phosphoribosylaminoimidazole-succinocarboxamide synthase